MPTKPVSESPLERALAKVPDDFRTRLVKAYVDLKRRHADAEFDAVGTSAGKLCEAALRLLQKEITGSYQPFGKKIDNFPDACRALITSSSSSIPESLRVIVPRALVYLYTMRNKRDMGHAGGDVEANRIDSATVARVADWVMCELIRRYHGMSLEDAQDLVDAISVRDLPDVWRVGGIKRVLRQDLSKSDATLYLLYSEPSQAVPADELCEWVEYSSFSMFETRVLRPLHERRYVEYDKAGNVVHLSPTGARFVEDEIVPKGPLARAEESSSV